MESSYTNCAAFKKWLGLGVLACVACCALPLAKLLGVGGLTASMAASLAGVNLEVVLCLGVLGATGRWDLSVGARSRTACGRSANMLNHLPYRCELLQPKGRIALLTRVDMSFAGRAYAAYGGIYIAMALLWLAVVEGAKPDQYDLIGVAICLFGTAIIVCPSICLIGHSRLRLTMSKSTRSRSDRQTIFGGAVMLTLKIVRTF